MLSDCCILVANLKTEVPSHVQEKRLQMELDTISTLSLMAMEGIRQRSTCKYQISREGYAKHSTGSKVGASVGQQELKSDGTE